MDSTTTTPVFELADRKRWAREASKCLKHSRAFRDLLAHLAFRAGSGRVWNYSLADLSEDSNVSKSQVRRGVAQFVQEGLITVKRHGPMASEYTLLFFDGSTPQRVSISAQRVSITAQRVSISDMPSLTKKETLKETETSPPPPPPPPEARDGDRDSVSFQPSAGNKGIPLVNPQDSSSGAEGCIWCGGQRDGASLECRSCRRATSGGDNNRFIQLKDVKLSPVVEWPKGFCDRCGERLTARDVRATCKDCMNETSPYMQQLRKGK